jgi:hypothetical protein
MIVKVTEDHTGPLPVFHVVKEVIACVNCHCTEDQIIESFHSYAEASAYCDGLIADGKAADDYTTPCGEEQL